MTADTHQPVFVTADTQFHILDPDTLPVHWGPRADGIGAGLAIDRASFALGEPIPLHLQWENFAATEAVGVTECGYPQPNLEIQDESHRVLGTVMTDSFGCMGHGWGPFTVPRGKPQRDSIRLEYGVNGYTLPAGRVQISGPGVYYLVLVWSPPIFIDNTGPPNTISTGRDTFGKTYATARSEPVRLEILPAKN